MNRSGAQEQLEQVDSPGASLPPQEAHAADDWSAPVTLLLGHLEDGRESRPWPVDAGSRVAVLAACRGDAWSRLVDHLEGRATTAGLDGSADGPMSRIEQGPGGTATVDEDSLEHLLNLLQVNEAELELNGTAQGSTQQGRGHGNWTRDGLNDDGWS